MSMTAALRDVLKQSPSVGSLVAARVYRDQLPQGGSVDAIVIRLISDPRPLTFAGAQSVRPSRVQIDCLAASRGRADEIGEAVILVINGRALSGVPPFESVRIANVRADSSRDEPATTFRTIIDAVIWHNSTT